MALVETVSGPIEAGELGLTLAHEHLRTTSEAVREQYPHLYDPEAERAAAIAEVRRAMEHGVRTIVDPACMDLGRDVALAREVVAETGIQLVMCTGIYGAQYTFLPQHFANRDVDYLADAFVHDIEVGIQGTDVKAAFLKCAVDEPGVTEHIEKVLRAVARASKRTGRPIMAHSHPATRRGLEIMDVFDSRGRRPGQGADRPHRRHRRPRLHRGAARVAAPSSAWTATASTSSCRPRGGTRPWSSSASAATPSG